jgi:hypothetical protein
MQSKETQANSFPNSPANPGGNRCPEPQFQANPAGEKNINFV